MTDPYRTFGTGSPTGQKRPFGYTPEDLLNPLTARGLVSTPGYMQTYGPPSLGGAGGVGTLPGLNSYDSIGKTMTKLQGQPSTIAQPGELTRVAQEGTDIYEPPPQVAPMGAFEGLFRGILEEVGGFMPADIRAHVANGLGAVANLLDIPAEFIGNAPQIPLPQLFGPPEAQGFVSKEQFFGALPMTEEKKRAQDQMKADPMNALFYMSQYLQFNETEIAHGLGVSPLVSDFFVPSNNLGDQVLRTLGLLGLPGRLTTRAFADSQQRNLEGSVLQADPNSLNPELLRIRQEYEQGKITREEFVDVVAKSGFGFSNNLYHNMLFEIITDPLLVASMGTGLGLKLAATSGRVAMIGKTVKLARTNLSLDEAAKMDAWAIGRVARSYADRRMDLGADQAKKMARDSSRFEWLREHHPQFEQQAMSEMSTRGRAIVSLDPLIQGSARISRAINSPFDLWGQITHRGFKNGERIAEFSSGASVEGMFQAYGLSRIKKIQTVFDNVGMPDMLQEIFGRMAANLEVSVAGDTLSRVAQEAKGLPYHLPDEIIRAQSETYHSRLALQIEGYMRRVMTQHLPTTKFGKEATEEGMAQARQVAKAQLADILGPAADAKALAAIDNIVKNADSELLALIEHMRFGGPVAKNFINARSLARSSFGETALLLRKKMATGGKGGGPMVGPKVIEKAERGIKRAEAREALWGRATLIGPKHLTLDDANRIIRQLKDHDVVAAREAVEQYEQLFSNFAAKGLDDDALVRDLDTFLKELKQSGSLTVVKKRTELPRELKDWLDAENDFANRAGLDERVRYRVGLAPEPEKRWREVRNPEGTLIGVNAWTDVVPDVASGHRVNSLNIVRDRLFRPIRGERHLEESRRTFRRRAVEDYGLSRSQANALFGAIRRRASQANTMPRGLTANELTDLLTEMNWDEATVQRVGARGMARLVTNAFEGDTFTVGITQKISGRAKGIGARLPGGNWLGVVSERIYPMARFSYNPIFLLQEAAEPFFWNILRGVKPGMRWTQEDLKSFEALRRSGFLGEWADQWEYTPSALLLIGGKEAHRVAGPGTRISEATKHLLGEGRKVRSLAELKRLNYLRQNSRTFGLSFKKFVEDLNPSLWDEWVREVGSADPTRVGNWYWMNKAWNSPDDPNVQGFLYEANLPQEMGESARQQPQALATHHRFINFDSLRRAVREGSYTEAQFKTAMKDISQDVYAERAWAMTSHIGPRKFWELSGDAYALARGNGVDAKKQGAVVMREMRKTMQQFAKMLNFSEEEYISRFLSKPMKNLDSSKQLKGIDAHYQLVSEPGNTLKFYGHEMVASNANEARRISREARAVAGTPTGTEAEMQRLIEQGGLADTQGFNAWRNGLWEGLKSEGKTFPPTGHYYRAMSDAEFKAGQESGVFKPLLGEDLYVTSDPDRLAGGAYGAKGGGYIVEIDPSLTTHKTTSRTVRGLEEEAVSSVDRSQITRIWKWDEKAGDHIPVGPQMALPAEPTGQTIRYTGAAIDGSMDGSGADLRHVSGPGLDYDSVSEMAEVLLGSDAINRIVDGNRAIAPMFDLMTKLMPDDLVARFTVGHVLQPGRIHEQRLRVEALRAEKLLEVQTDIAPVVGQALPDAKQVGEYIDWFLRADGGGGTDYFDMNLQDMMDVRPNVAKGPPNTGVMFTDELPSGFGGRGEEHTFYGWYDENGDLVATADVMTDLQELDRAVKVPTTPGGPVLEPDIQNMELEGLGTPAFPVPGRKAKNHSDVLRLFTGRKPTDLPRADVADIVALGTREGKRGQGYGGKLIEFIDTQGKHKYADITGRGSYEIGGAEAAASWLKKQDHATLRAAREVIASRLMAGFSHLVHRSDLDTHDIIRAMQGILEAGSGKIRPQARGQAYLAMHQMLELARIGGDEITPNWQQRSALEAMMHPDSRQVDAISPSMEGLRAHGYVDEQAARDIARAQRHGTFGNGQPIEMRWLSRDEVRRDALARGELQQLGSDAEAREMVEAYYEARLARDPDLVPMTEQMTPAIFSKMQQDYRKWAGEANANAWAGRTDWTAADVQAVNVARYRTHARRTGGDQGAEGLMRHQFVSLNFELEPHPGTDFYETVPNTKWVNEQGRGPEFVRNWNEGLAQASADNGRYWASVLGEDTGVSVVHVSVAKGKSIFPYRVGGPEQLTGEQADYLAGQARIMAGEDAYNRMVANDEWDEYVGDFIEEGALDNWEEFSAYGPQISIIITGSPESIEAAVAHTGATWQRREVIASRVDYAADPGVAVNNRWDQDWVTDFVVPKGVSEDALGKLIDRLWDEGGEDLARSALTLPDGSRAVRVFHEVGVVNERGIEALRPLRSGTDATLVSEIESMGVKVQRGVVDMYRQQVDITRGRGDLIDFFEQQGEFVDSTGKTIKQADIDADEWDSRIAYHAGKLADPWLAHYDKLGAEHAYTALRNRRRGEALAYANVNYWKRLGEYVEEWRSRGVNLPAPVRGYHYQLDRKGIRAATAVDTDLNASIFLLPKVGPDSIPHELLHSMVPHFEDSMHEAIRDAYSAATGKRRKTNPGGGLSEVQEEWLAEEFVRYVTTGQVRDSKLQSAFNMMGKMTKEHSGVKKLSEAHPDAKALFDKLFGQENSALSAVPFDPEQYRMLAMARYLMSQSEEEAHTTHYFRRGRSFLERSVNHPYLGYYPASYMWGKVLPELVRFLVREPFGIKAPMAGYMMASHVSQAVLLQLNTDPEFREWVEKHPQLIRFVQMMVPGTPWDIPVNLPAWARHTAEAEAQNQLRLAAGQERKGLGVLENLEDTTSYAFGVTRFLGTGADILKEFQPEKEEVASAVSNLPVISPQFLQSFGSSEDVAGAAEILSTP